MNKLKLPDKLFGVHTDILLLWIKPGLLLLFILLSVLGVFLPKIGEIQAKIQSIKNVDQKKVEVDQKRNYLLSVDQEEIKNNAELLSAGVLPEKNAYLLVKIIRNAVADVNYSVDEFSVSLGDIKDQENEINKSKNLNYDKIPVKLTLIGPKENYLALVKVLENSLPLMSIDEYEMSSSGGVATIDAGVSAYYLKSVSNLKIENLTLADLTLKQEESDLLSKIKEFKMMSVEKIGESGTFVKYERTDPFFTL